MITSLLRSSLLFLSVLSLNTWAEIDLLTVSHANFNQPLKFQVTLPDSYQSKPDKRYVMLFDFHPLSTRYLSGMHNWLSHNGEWPWLESIIVTPAPGNPVAQLFDASGKTTPLIDFFADTLFPTIEHKYRTNGFRIMSGFRVNGTLVLSTLLNRPDAANAYIAVSPQLSNDYAALLSSTQKKLQKLNDSPRFLLFTHGKTVKEDHQFSDYQHMQHLLDAASPSLDWHYRAYTEAYFMSLPLLSVIEGVELLFDDIHNGLPSDSAVSQQGVAAIVSHYRYLSDKKYGFEVSPARSIENLAFGMLEDAPEKAVNVLQENLKMFPDNAYSYHNLAKAHAANGELDKAIEVQTEAVEKGKSMLTWHQKRLQKQLDELTTQHSAQPSR